MGRREHCAAELRLKLGQRDYPDEVIAAVLARLREDGHLSESRFAEAFLRMRLKAGETPWLAAQKARQRGVEEVALQDALQAMQDDYDGLEACRRLIARRDPLGLRHADENQWQRQARFLRNKGFDAATIVRALKENQQEQGMDQ
ncbi:MAG: ABC transporter permease [Zetaproteobacteria bacterium CG06_land_8_20_14_3_00_59_53]|nr:MAG: ABC transporter permease [Zetaproteobacteria bacterium CG23_combo_of_CG06-09_8_20_14_all_59_86]PIQ65372.1 MAG: ABC transporter permease [Zetaproteobacteria bacterium CG11_big_fil_rev_8_21_14_0_20_59_439]PIU71066.1 MAG: ABC transporter permease [Zetaproteobacteria bacterium CG06_land_8_20_14_3_00_59_53]PIU98170.1 MAG: ABC transporter permease [Zetaproteobacteria bacterium CG03_land_8_20_14_0_80_59_51]PIY45525.1 MAG: ABC transporter permease [Zetaproteobacteria bacterium CG_4_10_14_0_8_um